MSEIEMKIKESTSELVEVCDKLTKGLAQHLNNGLDIASTQEVAMVADSIKDLCLAKEKCVKAMYYEQLMEAMAGSEYGIDYDENGPRYYRGRSAETGRFVHRKGYWDMDHESDEAHSEDYEAGHSDGYQKGYEDARSAGIGKNSKYERSMRGYEEADKANDKQAKMQNLQQYLDAIHEDLNKRIMTMDSQEKQLVKNSLQAIQNKI